MISGITIENFRGIERLDIDGLAQANLFIGRNDSGKTTVLEALWWATSEPQLQPHLLIGLQRWRAEGLKFEDFERTWAPMFRNADVRRGAKVEIRRVDAEATSTWLHRSTEQTLAVASLATSPPWALQLAASKGVATSEHTIAWDGSSLQLPPVMARPDSPAWIQPYANVTPLDVLYFSQLKQADRLGDVMKCVRLADESISELDLLSPDGRTAELSIRRNGGPMLPLYTLGQGVVRVLEMALAIGSGRGDIYVDEIENGLHHALLYDFWSRVLTMLSNSGAQLFATTHSEECIQAACRAFGDANNEGLRIIRLDRVAGRTQAAVYDADTARAAEHHDIDIRG